MEDHGEGYGNAAWMRPPELLAPRRRGRRWLVIGGLAAAFALALAVGGVIGSTIVGTHAAALPSAGGSAALGPGSGPGFAPAGGVGARFGPAGFAADTPGAQGPCATVTVSSVSGQTIVAKAADGSAVTIHTTSGTQYTQAGKAASAGAVKAGVQIRVMGTRNSDGSITATSIDIGG